MPGGRGCNDTVGSGERVDLGGVTIFNGSDDMGFPRSGLSGPVTRPLTATMERRRATALRAPDAWVT
jgi:hypothetical protein